MIPGLLFLLVAVTGQTNVPPASSAPPADLKQIAPGIYEYHSIKLDKKNARVSFPAIVNQREGAIEYLLVNEKGKVHESVISTTLAPHDIHLALLLIGLKETVTPKETAPPSAIDSAYLKEAPKLRGTPVLISVSWMMDGKRKEIPAEDWIFNSQTKKPMTHGAWTYNGSMVDNGVFLADQEYSLIALVTDPTALVNNPRPGYDNDTIWQPRETIPPLNTPLEVSITLSESTPTKKP